MIERTQVTESELLAELRKSVAPAAPPEAMTVAEMAQAERIGKTAVRAWVLRMKAEGRLVTWRASRPDANGRMQTVPAYTILPEKKKEMRRG